MWQTKIYINHIDMQVEMQQVPKIKGYKQEMWMRLLSKISKDYHMIKQIDWFKNKRNKNQQNSLWLSSQPMMEQIFMQEYTNTMVVYMWQSV
jgi:hypothetical protein